MSLDYLCEDNYDRRHLCMCPCMINERLKYNDNFELNSRRLRGVLFDPVKLICDLDENTKIEDSQFFEHYEVTLPDTVNRLSYTICFSNGISYIGDFSKNKFNGEGRLYIGSHLYYSGEFKNNLFHGYGELYSKYCDIYFGEFNEGFVNGKGKVEWCNGSSYEGYFKNNLLDGEGIYKYKNGSIYEGNYNFGFRNGSGKLTTICRNKIKVEIITDDWKYNKIFGRGTIKSNNKPFYYKGDIETFNYLDIPNTVVYAPHGRGLLLNNLNKEIFVGHFKHGLKSGNGNEYFDNGSKKYSGSFTENLYHGNGKLFDISDNIIFEGNFCYGKKNGFGMVCQNLDSEMVTYKLDKKFGMSVKSDSNLKKIITYCNEEEVVSKKFKDIENNSDEVGDSCSICQNKYKKNDLVTKFGECNHYFHSECLFKWLEKKEDCPLCRSEKLFDSKKRKHDQITCQLI